MILLVGMLIGLAGYIVLTVKLTYNEASRQDDGGDDLTNAFRTMKKGEALTGPEHQSKAGSSSSSSASSHSDDAASNSEEGQSDFGDSDSNSDTGKAVQIKGKGNAPSEPAPPVKPKKALPHHKKNKPSSDKSPAKTSAISEASLTLLVHL